MNKILNGLEGAIEYVKCTHDMIVQKVAELGDGRTSVTSRCDKCGGRETKFYPQGVIEIVELNKP